MREFMKKGDFVKVDYTGRIKESGRVFDTTSEDVAKKEDVFNSKVKYGPVLVIVGHSKIVKGLDEEIEKMEVGQKKEVGLEPERAFGKRDPNMMKLMPLSEFKKQDVTPYPGMVLNMEGLSARVISVNSGRVRVDFNHPLAGKDLVYELEVKEKLEKDEEKVKAICDYYGCDADKIKTCDKAIEIVQKNDVNTNVKQMITNDIFDHMDFDKISFSLVFNKKK